MKHAWFYIWLVGNGGIPHSHKYVFWPDYSKMKDEMAYMVEHEFSPLCGDTRSLNWKKQKPPKSVVEERIKDIKSKLKYLRSELKIHKDSLD